MPRKYQRQLGSRKYADYLKRYRNIYKRLKVAKFYMKMPKKK